MAKDRISEIEEMMVEVLQAAMPGVKVESRITPMNETQIAKMLALVPLCVVEYNGGSSQAKNETGKSNVRRLAFNLFVGAKSLRSKSEGSEGCYGMLSSIRATLDGVIIRDDEDATKRAGPFAWENEAIFFDSPEGTMYQAVYSVSDQNLN